MKKYIGKEKGITLVALVITIIILLILATISIQSLTHTGMFASANKAKLDTKRSQISEWLGLEVISEQTNNPTGSAEQIINQTHKNVLDKQEELKRFGKDIKVEDVSTEEDGEQVDVYFYVVVDKDIYKVDLKNHKFIGELGKMLPVIKIVSISNTTNSIKVKVKTSRNEGGSVEYYIKSEDDTRYTLKATKNDDSEYVYDNLIQGKKYSVKVVAKAENGQSAEAIAEQTTGTIINLKEGDLEFTSKPSTWTNTDVEVTVKANIDIKGYQLLTSQNPDKGWNKATSQIFKTNGIIYAVLSDGVNYGVAASRTIQNIDKTKPTVSTALSSTSAGINSVSLSIGVTDANSGLGKVEWYYGTTNNPTTKAGTTSVTNLNGSATGPTTAQTKTYTVSGLTAGTTYYFKAVVYDVAGNQVSSPIISAKTIVNSKEIGDEVTVGGEQFYVLNWDDNSDTVDLISKYNLNQAGTAQQNAAYGTTACAFSSTNYWSSSITSSPFDLNYFGGYMDTDAIGKAKSYGKIKGAVSSRLLSYEEAKALEAKKDSNTKIYTMYRGTANTANGCLHYWLGSAYGPNDTDYVWSVGGDFGFSAGSFSSSYYYGVRPVITILKSKIS